MFYVLHLSVLLNPACILPTVIVGGFNFQNLVLLRISIQYNPTPLTRYLWFWTSALKMDGPIESVP